MVWWLLTEARKIAAMADTATASGAARLRGSEWTASTHLSLHAADSGNVRAFYTGWYKELVTEA